MAADDILGLRDHAYAVLGPPPDQVFPEVDPDLFRRDTVDYLQDLLTRPQTRAGARPEVVAGWIANVARCLFRLATRELGSKRAAIAWWVDADPAMRDILDLVGPAVRGEAAAGIACVEAFPIVVDHAEAFYARRIDVADAG